MRQAGGGADRVDLSKPGEISFFHLDGDVHRKRRAAVAGLFAPKTIVTRHQAVMNRTMDDIVAKLQRRGSAPLDELSWQMAAEVAADIIGLTNSDNNEALANRVKSVLDASLGRKKGWLSQALFMAKMTVRVGHFWKKDMVPAIEARRKDPKDDVITYMVKGELLEARHDHGGPQLWRCRHDDHARIHRHVRLAPVREAGVARALSQW